MNRKILLFATPVFFVASSTNAFAQTCQQRVYENSRKATLFIQVDKYKTANGAVTGNTGTGFIISPAGYVLTNYHVIKLADDQDKRAITAKISSRDSPLEYKMVEIDHDERSDVALLRIQDTSRLYPFLLIGDPNKIGLGQLVCSGGFPRSEDYHPSFGIVGEPYDAFLTTDMASDEGESGAPVFGSGGQVVAIRVGGFDSSKKRSLVIPINLASGLIAKVTDHKNACYIISSPPSIQLPPLNVKLSLDGGSAEVVEGDPYAFACDSGSHTFNFEFDWDMSLRGGPNITEICKTVLVTTPGTSYALVGHASPRGPFAQMALDSCTLVAH